MARWIFGLLCGAAFFAALYAVTLTESGVACEVCLRYRGRQDCATVSGPDREHAVSQATATVCARISSGVTDGIACGNTPPLAVRCPPSGG